MEAAREELIQGNLRLVAQRGAEIYQPGENMDDLFQVGCIGLIKAIDNFNLDLMVKFSTYGVPMIIGEIPATCRDNNAIRVSRSMRDTAHRAMQVKEALIAEKLPGAHCGGDRQADGRPQRTWSRPWRPLWEPVSLYEPVYSDGGDTIYVVDQVGDPSRTPTGWMN